MTIELLSNSLGTLCLIRVMTFTVECLNGLKKKMKNDGLNILSILAGKGRKRTVFDTWLSVKIKIQLVFYYHATCRY